MSGTKKTRVQLEAIFANGQRPTGQNFADLFASSLMPEDVLFPQTQQIHIGKNIVATGGTDNIAHIVRQPWIGKTTVTLLGWGSADFDCDIIDDTVAATIWTGRCSSALPIVVAMGNVTGTNAQEVLRVAIRGTLAAEVYVEAIIMKFEL